MKELEEKLQRLEQNRPVAEQDGHGMGNVERGIEDLSLEDGGVAGDQGMSLPGFIVRCMTTDTSQQWLMWGRKRVRW